MAKTAAMKKQPIPPDLVYHDIEQSSADWYQIRFGLATCSNFATIMAEGEQKGRSTLLRKLAGELMTDEPQQNYSSPEMEKGKEQEADILDWYSRTKFADVKKTGFVFNPAVNFAWNKDPMFFAPAGWSPDGLVGDEGAIEMKWHRPDVMIALLEKGTFPTEHRAQCHGALLVGRRRWIDYVAYSHPKLPKYVARIEVDPLYQKQISDAIEIFNWDLKKLVERMQRMMR